MDAKQFETITKAMGRELTRRRALGRLVAGVAATSGLAAGLRSVSITGLAAEDSTNPANYYVDADCRYDAVADTTTCTFTGSVTNGDKDISHVDVMVSGFCAEVVGMTDGIEYAEDDPSVDGVEGWHYKYNTIGGIAVFDLTFAGNVSVDGAYTADPSSGYIIKAGKTGFYVAGDTLVCGPTLIYGCSAGYYKNHPFSLSGSTLASVGFNVDPSITFAKAIDPKQVGDALIRQAATAYLNAYYGLAGFPHTTDDIVAGYNAGTLDPDTLKRYNDGDLATGGCPGGTGTEAMRSSAERQSQSSQRKSRRKSRRKTHGKGRN